MIPYHVQRIRQLELLKYETSDQDRLRKIRAAIRALRTDPDNIAVDNDLNIERLSY